MQSRTKLNIATAIASVVLLGLGLALALNTEALGRLGSGACLVAFLVLVFTKIKYVRQFAGDITATEELKRKMYEDAYTNPKNHPSPDSYKDGLG